MIDRPAPTQTFYPSPTDDSSTMASPSRIDGPHDFVPLRMRSEAGAEIVEIDQPFAVFGRHSDADVRLTGPDVSRRHCQLYFEDGIWNVRDLSSLNGVFINGERVRVASLNLGDRLRIGATTFLVERAAARGPKSQRIKSETLRSIVEAIEG